MFIQTITGSERSGKDSVTSTVFLFHEGAEIPLANAAMMGLATPIGRPVSFPAKHGINEKAGGTWVISQYVLPENSTLFFKVIAKIAGKEELSEVIASVNSGEPLLKIGRPTLNDKDSRKREITLTGRLVLEVFGQSDFKIETLEGPKETKEKIKHMLTI